MDRFVARLNIERFQQMLASAVDETERQRLRLLLAEEEEKLAEAERAAAESNSKHPSSKIG